MANRKVFDPLNPEDMKLLWSILDPRVYHIQRGDHTWDGFHGNNWYMNFFLWDTHTHEIHGIRNGAECIEIDFHNGEIENIHRPIEQGVYKTKVPGVYAMVCKANPNADAIAVSVMGMSGLQTYSPDGTAPSTLGHDYDLTERLFIEE